MGKKVWASEDLQTFNTVAIPVFVFSCATSKLIWANRAAVQIYGLPLDRLLTFRFSKTSDDSNATALAALTSRVRQEVEVGGGELVLDGGNGPVPGVIPYPADQCEFLYQQIFLGQPDMDTTVCTLIQVRSAPPRTPTVNSKTTTVKMFPRSGSGQVSLDKHKPAAGLSMPAIIDLVESILAGQPISMDSVESLHQMLIRGELFIQNTRISEELLVKEELDKDVGLNLLQLLGNSSTLRSTTELDPSIDGLSLTDSEGISMSPRRVMSLAMPLESSGGSGTNNSGPLSSTINSNYSGEDEDTSVVVASLLPAMEAVLATVDEWRFDAFKLAEATAGHPMSALGFWFIKRAGLIESLQIDAQALSRFLRKVEDSYPDNCYHNKTHAADVLQSMHVLMTRGGLLRRLGDDTSLLMLAGYLAAIIHDNEHKGLNNDFLVRISDDLALTYNDTSPMENHHVAAAFRVMRCQCYNFMRRMSRERLTRLRRLLIEMVLATDMKQHFNILSKFQAKLQVKLRTSNSYGSGSHMSAHDLSSSRRLEVCDDELIVEDEVDRSLVMQVALKCADVGHLAAPWEVHHRWVSGLEEEFFRQGDKEKAAHLMVSPLMDRCKDGITKSQVGFFDIVALPLFYSWAAVFHEALPLVRAVEDNCNRWRMLEQGRHASK